MPNIGPMEIAIVLIIALIVLGPKRLPEAGKSLGKGLKGFKESMSGIMDTDDEAPRERPAITETSAAPVVATTAAPDRPAA
jgi:sec-independent protein translocase protein TatA